MPAETDAGEPLTDGAKRVLRFSVEHTGSDGLRYEDYMQGLTGPLQGIDVNGLSTALHQLESTGYLLPDPLGTPGRRIRLTPKAREVGLGGAAAPTPQEVREEAADPNAPRLKPGGPAGTSERPRETAIPSSPSPATHVAGGTMDDREKMIEQRDEESRKRLKLVIEREDAVRGAEEKLRTEEKRLLGEEERLSERTKSLEAEKAEHLAKMEETKKALEAEKTQLENERKRLQSAGQALQRHQFELEQKDQQLKTATASLEERSRAADQKTRELTEREKVIVDQEDALHEHLTAVKSHLGSVRSTEEGISKVHEAVSASRARRGK